MKQLAVLFLFALSACSPIAIKNDPWCADAGKYGAECFYTLSNESFTLDKYQWDRLRVGQICTASNPPAEPYKNIKKALLKLCADTSRCDFEQVENFTQKADKALKKASR